MLQPAKGCSISFLPSVGSQSFAGPTLRNIRFMSELIPQLTQQLFNGLSLGAIYALIAIGYTMVYGIIGMINFAHGEIYMIGAYVGLVTLSALGVNSGLPLPVVILIMLIDRKSTRLNSSH